jgi:deoxyadenosine/deoxycytidine kinase
MLCEGGFMEQRDYKCYVELFANMSNFMYVSSEVVAVVSSVFMNRRKPNLIIYLEVTPEQSQSRVNERYAE